MENWQFYLMTFTITKNIKFDIKVNYKIIQLVGGKGSVEDR